MKSIAVSVLAGAWLVFLSSISPVLAGGDNFDDNIKDPSKWGDDVYFSTANITLQEANGRLEVLKTAGLDASGVFRPWIASTGSYTQDWETVVDLHLSDISLDPGTSVNVNLVAANQDDPAFGDIFDIALDLYNEGGVNYRGYEMTARVGGSDLTNAPNYGYVTTADTDGRVKIAFTASSKVLTASYNGTVLGWIDVDDAASDWGMTAGSVFGIAIVGAVDGSSVGLASGDMYADDFSLTSPPSSDFSYTTNNGEITITGYLGSGGNVTIPDSINGLPVTAIGSLAFYSNTNSISLIIPDSVTRIADNAFYNCTGLNDVNIGNGVGTIGVHAFYHCLGLTTVNFSGSLTNLSDSAFASCYNIKALCFEGDAPVMGPSVFSGANALVYRLSTASGWTDTFGGLSVKTIYPVATAGLSMGGIFDGTNYLLGVEDHQTSTNRIAAQMLSADGEKTGSLIMTGRSGISTDVAFDGTNSLLVWEDNGLGTLNGTTGWQIYGQFISPSGSTVGSPFAISTVGVWFDGIKVMQFGGGKYLVTYTRLITPELGNDSTNRYIAGCMVDPSGSVGSEFRISSGYGQDSGVAFDGSSFFVIWCEDQYDREIRGRFVSPDGTPGTEISVNASAYPSDNPKAVAFDGNNYLVVWNDETGGHGSEIWGAFGQLVSTDGTLVGDVITIVDDPGAQLVTSLAFDGVNYLALWTDMQNGNDWDVYGQYISPAGALIGDPVTVMTCGDNQLGGVGFANGKYIVVGNDGVVMGENGIVDVDGAYAMFITPPADSDTNGLPDLWEVEYFGSTGTDPSAICSNGINTVQEAYIAGINPANPNDFFAIAGGDIQTGSIWWNAVSGRVYSVYWTTNLLDGFQCLESNILWDTGAFTDSVHNAETKGFYQLKVQLEN